MNNKMDRFICFTQRLFVSHVKNENHQKLLISIKIA